MLRGIPGLEILRHQTKRFAWQAGFERTSTSIDDKDVMALLDRRGRQPGPAEHTDHDRDHCDHPGHQPRGDGAPEDEHGRDDEQPVAKEVVDREPEPRDQEQQRCEPHPGLMRINGLRSCDVGERFQCTRLALPDGIARDPGEVRMGRR